MALDKLVDSAQLDAALTYEAGKIRAKLGSSAQISFDLANQKGFGDVIDAIPSGGGGSGATKIASGTITGADNRQFTVPVGKKMPQADFVFNLWVDNGTEFAYSNNYQIVNAQFLLQKRFGYFDLSTDGSKRSSEVIRVDSNNSGTITERTTRGNTPVHINIRNGGLAAAVFGNPGGSNNCLVIRSSTGFSIQMDTNSNTTILASGKTYNWELLYFGSSPTTDIVEVP